MNPLGATQLNNNEGIASSSSSSSGIEKDGFLKMLMATITNQNPLEPMKNSDMMAQMAQMTQIEQMMKMEEVVNKMHESVAGSQLQQAAGFIGKQVEAYAQDGSMINGEVNSVSRVDGKLKIWINDNTSVMVDQIKRISE